MVVGRRKGRLLRIRGRFVAQLVKNPPAMWDTWVQSLGWEDPLEKGMAAPPIFWPGEFHGLYSPWGRKELDTTERLSLHFTSEVGRVGGRKCFVLLYFLWKESSMFEGQEWLRPRGYSSNWERVIEVLEKISSKPSLGVGKMRSTMDSCCIFKMSQRSNWSLPVTILGSTVWMLHFNVNSSVHTPALKW